MPRPIETTSMRINPPSIVVFTHLSCCSNRAAMGAPPVLRFQLPGEKAAGSHVACRKSPVTASGSLLAKREDPEIFPDEFSFKEHALLFMK
jgi:hypothetical protein